METYKDIAATTLNALVHRALDELERKNPAVNAEGLGISKLYDEILSDPALPEQVRTKIDEYINRSTAVTMEHYRCLYYQGAKDCVALLRDLGVLQ